MGSYLVHKESMLQQSLDAKDKRIAELEARNKVLEDVLVAAKGKPLLIGPTRVVYERPFYRKLKEAIAAADKEDSDGN